MSEVGLEAQRDGLHAEKTHRGWTNVIWIEDNGWSAKSLERPGITEALRQLRAGEAGVLVVTKLDRLSRSIVHFSRLLKQAERERWAIIALDLDLDMTTATGMVVAKTVAVIAEWERETIREFTRAGLQAKKQARVRLGRPRQTPDDTLFRVVELRKAGWTLQQIADQLKKERHPTTRGGRWWPSTIKALLDSFARD
jgi:DNA invertase Pin-like site-specific DNA recombinase